MHIRITQLDARPEDAMAELQHRPGMVAAYVMRPMDQKQPILATVWEAVEYADLSPVTVGGQDYADGRFEGRDSVDDPAAYASIIYFDGPRPQAEADAIDRANRERIAPAVRDLPGNLGAFVGRNPDGSFVVLTLTRRCKPSRTHSGRSCRPTCCPARTRPS